jgi:hypothetical protein
MDRLRPLSLLTKAPPAEAVAAAGLWSALLDFGFVAILLAGAINAWAPTQDLPWKPLDLTRPPGLATRAQFGRTADDPDLCRAALVRAGVEFADEPDRTVGDCSTKNAVRVRDGVTRLSPPAPVMTCPVALAYIGWERHVVQPAAREVLGAPVTGIEHFGTYACRNVYGREQGRRSEHAGANAVDVHTFVLAGGRQVSVQPHYRLDDPRGGFLRRVRDGACRWFRATLGPEYNAAHRDHFHLDRGPYRLCR